MMTLLEQLKSILPIDIELPKVYCTIFEDNNSCIELVKCPKMRSRTNYIRLKYHQFRSTGKEEMVTVNDIDTKYQIARIFTKALPEAIFNYLRKLLSGW